MYAEAADPAYGQDTSLFDLVFQRISESDSSSVPFSVWMEMALYHPQWGYYSRSGVTGEEGFRTVGRAGDFFTSVSVGETFGLLLASRILRDWEHLFDSARPFIIVEQGAHDGRLARDILAGLREISVSRLDEFEYRIVEPRAWGRDRLEAELARDPEPQIRIVSSLSEARAPAGVFLCNELLDAFPVDRILFQEGAWKELHVGWNSEMQRPEWVSRPLRNEWREFAQELGDSFPEGYISEICPEIESWMQESAQLFETGLWMIIDYGYERSEYYSPRRNKGTLRCYQAHQAGEDPFAFPGEQDITAHVDFTRVEEVARLCGLNRRNLIDQHHFLIEAARPWLLRMEGRLPDQRTQKRLRQFQTLTHPSLMGQCFHVMEFTRGIRESP